MYWQTAGGKICWTEIGIPTISRANFDETNVEELVTTGISRPRDIALDAADNKMYWTGENFKCLGYR